MRNSLLKVFLAGWLLLFVSSLAQAVSYTFSGTSYPACSNGSWSQSGSTWTCNGSFSLNSGDTISPASSLTIMANGGMTLAGSNTVGSSSNTVALQTSYGSVTVSGTTSIHGSISASGSGNITLTSTTVTGAVSTSGSVSLNASNVSGNVTGSNGVTSSNGTVFGGSITSTNGSISVSGGSVTGNVSGGSGVTSASGTTFAGTVTSSTGLLSFSGGSVAGNVNGNGVTSTSGTAFGGTVSGNNSAVNLSGGSVAGNVSGNGVSTSSTNLSGGATSNNSALTISSGLIAGALTGNGITLTNATMTGGSITVANNSLSISNSALGTSTSTVTITSNNTVSLSNGSIVYGNVTAGSWSSALSIDGTSRIYGVCTSSGNSTSSPSSFPQCSALVTSCTSITNGSWGSSSTWSCGYVPGNTDTVILASPYKVTLNSSYSALNLTVNSGATLSDTQGSTLSVGGNLTNNGTITTTQSGKLNLTGASASIAGSGAYAGYRVYTSGATPQIAAGAILNFSGSSRFYTGYSSSGSTATSSVLTINGTINSTVTSSSTFLRLYANSTVIGTSGVINAGVSTASFSNSTAKLTNNGSVSLNKITQNKPTNAWTQGTNSSLTVSAVSTVGTLYASASQNTVTYTAPATPLTPSANTYYNLAGTGVVCPVSFIILGTSPCVAKVGAGSVTSSPGSCVNLTGVGTVAWSNPGNATASDTSYATAGNMSQGVTSNYLKCTGFNFAAVPVGATISGITVYVTRKSNSTSATLRDKYVYLLKAGTISTAMNGLTTTNYTTSDVAEQHGGSTNLWGGLWTDTDVKASTFGVVFAAQNASSNNWGCGDNGCYNYTASVNFIQMRVDYSATTVDHVAISAASLGSTCAVSNITIMAHTAAHAVPTGGGGTIKVTAGSGDIWTIVSGNGTLVSSGGVATYTYATSETSVVLGLKHSTAGTVTLGVTDGSNSSLTANTPSSELANTITFAGGGFTVTDVNGAAISSMTQIAGTTSPTYYLKATSASCTNAFSSSTYNIGFAFQCIDPVTCLSPVVSINSTALSSGTANASTPSSYKAVSLTFNSNSLAPFTLNYPDVGKIALYFSYTPSSMLSQSNPFVVKPAGFVLSGIKRTRDSLVNPAASDATGAGFVKSGEAFSATITAVTSSTTATPNYGHEVAPEYVKLVNALVSPATGNNPAITCADHSNATSCDASGTPDIPLFATFSAGVATGVNFGWDEVGVITLTPHVGDGDYMGTGDVVGTASANIGRFTLGKFALQNLLLDNRTDICSNGALISDGITACPAYTYMGEQTDASFTLAPVSLNNVPSQNYQGSYAKLNPGIFAGLNIGAIDVATSSNLTSRISNLGLPVVTCLTTPCFTQAGGAGSQVQADVNVPLMLSRGLTPDGNYTAVSVGIAPTDSDGAAVDALGISGIGTCNNTTAVACYDLDVNADSINDHALIGASEFRYGRSRIANAYGSEFLPLSLPVAIEYWNGTSYVTSMDDSISTLSLSLGNYQLNLSAGKTSMTSPVIASGLGQLGLSAPGLGGNGSVEISLSSPAYLPLVGYGRATFGIYAGNKVFIYRGRRGH